VLNERPVDASDEAGLAEFKELYVGTVVSLYDICTSKVKPHFGSNCWAKIWPENPFLAMVGDETGSGVSKRALQAKRDELASVTLSAARPCVLPL
jgi:hypothetical protein